MRYEKQTILHDPEQGQYGDCYRTALACLLELSPYDVPHFMEDPDRPMDDIWRDVDIFLCRFGLIRMAIAYDLQPYQVLQYMAEGFPRVVYLLAGLSPRGTQHVVIARGGEVLHDPHPDGGGIVNRGNDGFTFIELFVRDFGATL